TAAEPTDSRKSNAGDFDGFTVEHGHTSVVENLGDHFRLTGFIIVIPENGDDRNSHRAANIGGEFFGFFCKSVLGEIAAKQQHICALRGLGKRIMSATGTMRSKGRLQVTTSYRMRSICTRKCFPSSARPNGSCSRCLLIRTHFSFAAKSAARWFVYQIRQSSTSRPAA